MWDEARLDELLTEPSQRLIEDVRRIEGNIMVIGAGGNLTGFGGGISRKLQMLEHEGVDCSGFYVPKFSTAP